MVFYYAFFCQPLSIAFYWTAITLIAFLCMYVSFSPTFAKPGYEKYRAAMFSAMGLIGILAIPHGLLTHGFSAIWPFVWRAFGMGATYLSGVVFYVGQIPERFWPGKFDYTCHSHVIWHCFVIAGAFAHFQFLKWGYYNKDVLISCQHSW